MSWFSPRSSECDPVIWLLLLLLLFPGGLSRPAGPSPDPDPKPSRFIHCLLLPALSRPHGLFLHICVSLRGLFFSFSSLFSSKAWPLARSLTRGAALQPRGRERRHRGPPQPLILDEPGRVGAAQSTHDQTRESIMSVSRPIQQSPHDLFWDFFYLGRGSGPKSLVSSQTLHFRDSPVVLYRVS